MTLSPSPTGRVSVTGTGGGLGGAVGSQEEQARISAIPAPDDGSPDGCHEPRLAGMRNVLVEMWNHGVGMDWGWGWK